MKFVSALALFLAVGWAAATVDVCSESGLDNSTSGYCTCKSATIDKQPVAQISCSIDKTSSIFDGTVTAVLYPCTDPHPHRDGAGLPRHVHGRQHEGLHHQDRP